VALALPLARLAAWRPALAIATTAGLVAALTAGTFARNETWRSEVGLWTDAAEKSPLLPRAQMNLGVALARAGRHEEAIARYERARALDPGSAEIHYDLYFSLAATGRADEAEIQLDETLRLAPEHAGAQHLKGEAALRRGDLEQAIEHFRAALRANTRLALTHYRLGGALLAQGEIEEAGAHLQAAGRLDPQLDASARRAFAVSSASRGLLRLEQGDALGATQDLRAALAAEPTDAIAANGLAWILATHADPRLRDPQEAQRLADLARAEQPDEPAFLDTLAAAYASAGRFEEAVAALERADALAETLGDDGLRARLAERLRLYRAGKPYVEGRPPEPTSP
jgi:tetratricopeptide (TPR) repeat protein